MMNSEQTSRRFKVLVLAASRGEATLREFGTLHKCSLDVAGRPMLMRVLGAITASTNTGDMAISIDEPRILQKIPSFPGMAQKHSITILQSKSSAALSARDALDRLDPAFPLLVTTADNVMLTPEILDEFLQSAMDSKADLAFALVAKETIEAALPHSRRTYWQFRGGGGFTGCNLFALITPESKTIVELWRHAEANRKKPWKIVRLLGLGPLLGFVMKRWSLQETMERLSKRFGIKIAPVILQHAAIAVDVDTRDDLETARRMLAASEAKS